MVLFGWKTKRLFILSLVVFMKEIGSIYRQIFEISSLIFHFYFYNQTNDTARRYQSINFL